MQSGVLAMLGVLSANDCVLHALHTHLHTILCTHREVHRYCTSISALASGMSAPHRLKVKVEKVTNKVKGRTMATLL